jgi:hypothetical protein
MYGEFETTTTTTYDMQTIGPVCTVIDDVTTDYYDFSSQSVQTKETVNFEGTPQQITTISETVALQSETLDSVARRPQTAARTIAARMGPRVAVAESRIVASRAIRHLKMMRAFERAHVRGTTHPKA